MRRQAWLTSAWLPSGREVARVQGSCRAQRGRGRRARRGSALGPRSCYFGASSLEAVATWLVKGDQNLTEALLDRSNATAREYNGELAVFIVRKYKPKFQEGGPVFYIFNASDFFTLNMSTFRYV